MLPIKRSIVIIAWSHELTRVTKHLSNRLVIEQSWIIATSKLFVTFKNICLIVKEGQKKGRKRREEKRGKGGAHSGSGTRLWGETLVLLPPGSPVPPLSLCSFLRGAQSEASRNSVHYLIHIYTWLEITFQLFICFDANLFKKKIIAWPKQNKSKTK